MTLIYRKHAIMRMFERGIRDEDIRAVVLSGEVILDYPNDTPYPSCLILGWVDGNPIHVLTAQAENNLTIVITAYYPDPKLWESDFKRKRL
jgi:hypothetical protein